jgi:hypothetical protein
MASPTTVKVALLPLAVTPRKTSSGSCTDGSGVCSFSLVNGVSSADSGVAPGASVPNWTATS